MIVSSASRPGRVRVAVAVALSVALAWTGASAPAGAEVSLRELIEELQNPLPALVAIPVQNNFNIGYGPERGCRTASTSSRWCRLR